MILILGTILLGMITKKDKTAVILMGFFSCLAGVYLLLKILNQKYNPPFLPKIQSIFRYGLLVLGFLCILILALVSTPQFSCQNIPPQAKNAEAMIILGAGLKNGDQLSYSLKTRLDKALDVLKKHPHLSVVVSGGQGPDERITEAQAMQLYLIQNGVPASQLILEDRSRSTYENLTFSRQELEAFFPHFPQEPILLITSDFHQFRAQFIAQRLGLETIGICSGSYPSLKASYMIREIPAVINDFLGNILK